MRSAWDIYIYPVSKERKKEKGGGKEKEKGGLGMGVGHLVKFLLCKHKDLGLFYRYCLKNSQGVVAHTCKPTAGRKVDHWGSSQTSLLDNVQTSESPCLKEKKKKVDSS